MCGPVRLLTELRVVVLMKHTLGESLVSIFINRLRAVRVAFSSVHTHLILSVCVPKIWLILNAQEISRCHPLLLAVCAFCFHSVDRRSRSAQPSGKLIHLIRRLYPCQFADAFVAVVFPRIEPQETGDLINTLGHTPPEPIVSQLTAFRSRTCLRAAKYEASNSGPKQQPRLAIRQFYNSAHDYQSLWRVLEPESCGLVCA